MTWTMAKGLVRVENDDLENILGLFQQIVISRTETFAAQFAEDATLENVEKFYKIRELNFGCQSTSVQKLAAKLLDLPDIFSNGRRGHLVMPDFAAVVPIRKNGQHHYRIGRTIIVHNIKGYRAFSTDLVIGDALQDSYYDLRPASSRGIKSFIRSIKSKDIEADVTGPEPSVEITMRDILALCSDFEPAKVTVKTLDSIVV